MSQEESLAQRTASKLCELISEGGEYQPGDKLPNELELSAQLGVSRSTLREAIRSLTDSGVLTAHRGRGTFVAKKLPPAGRYVLSELGSIRTRLRDLYEMRLLYEPNMAALACLRATDEELALICEHGQKEAELIRNGEDRLEADQVFHSLIANATHNEFVISLNPLVMEAIGRTVSIAKNDRAVSETTLRDHALITEFIGKRDAAGARSAMEIHIRHVMDEFQLGDKGTGDLSHL